MIDWIRDRECDLAIDTSSDPVVIATWHGTATVDLVDRYYRWSDAAVAAAIAAEQRLIRITDLSQARRPSGAVCKRMYEHASNDLAAEVTLANYVVLDDPRLRGLMHGLGWVGGGSRSPDMIIVDRVETAIELALCRLWDERIPPPAGLDPYAYQPPRVASTLI